MDELEEKVKKDNKSKEITINVPLPEFLLCDTSDEEVKNEEVKKDIVSNNYVNNDLPEFAL